MRSEVMMENIKIASEQDAFEMLKGLIENKTLESVDSIVFEGWPKFVIRVQGEDFKGTIPTRIMPSLLELQKEVHKSYCLTVYGHDDTRKLSKKDREQLELVVKVDSGSSWFETLLDEKVLKIIQDATNKMSPEQLMIIAIVFSILIASTVSWKAWLSKRSKDKALDADLEKSIQLSKLEKEKLEVIGKATDMVPILSAMMDNINDFRSDITSKLKPSDAMNIANTSQETTAHPISLTGQQVESLTQTVRETAIEKKVEGSFLLLSADFTDKEGLRVQLRRQEDQYDFKAKIPLNVLDDEQIEILKDESWNKKPMRMTLIVKELHNRYTSSTVISVEMEAPKNQFNPKPSF